MNDAIFQSTGQALDVSFLIMSQPAAQDGALRKALIRILENVEEPTAAQQRWLAQLRGDRGSGTVNFAGLCSDEIRAQCAMITQSVRDRLITPESYAVLGQYTRMPFEKAEAVRYLSEYIKPDADSRKRLLYDYCVLRSTGKHGNDHVRSVRELANFGVNDKSVAAHIREIRKKVKVLRDRGEACLDSIFKMHGVVDAA